MSNQTIIVEAELTDGTVRVVKVSEGRYDVIVNDVVRHPGCDSEAVMRALGFYLEGVSYRYKRLSEFVI